jgi:GH24 family phage-related lysozyme (muramidase)
MRLKEPAHHKDRQGNAMTIDWDFIAELEGRRQLKGYVPAAATSQSGVTIATGVDLGHHTAREIAAWPIADSLKLKIAPYVGRVRQDAVAALTAQPLEIDENEAIQLETAVAGPLFDRLRASYDRAVGKDSFYNLPPQAQTVLASLAYQYGPALDKRTPKFWRLACAQDWTGCYKELNNFGDRYPTRRKKEAELLVALISPTRHE